MASSIGKNPAKDALINNGTYRFSIQWNPTDLNKTKEISRHSLEHFSCTHLEASF
jgi:hypothetical protein